MCFCIGKSKCEWMFHYNRKSFLLLLLLFLPYPCIRFANNNNEAVKINQTINQNVCVVLVFRMKLPLLPYLSFRCASANTFAALRSNDGRALQHTTRFSLFIPVRRKTTAEALMPMCAVCTRMARQDEHTKLVITEWESDAETHGDLYGGNGTEIAFLPHRFDRSLNSKMIAVHMRLYTCALVAPDHVAVSKTSSNASSECIEHSTLLTPPLRTHTHTCTTFVHYRELRMRTRSNCAPTGFTIKIGALTCASQGE